MTPTRIKMMPLFCEDPYLYDVYNQKVDERIKKLANGGWDDAAVLWHESGEIDDETFDRWIEEEACKQIYKEIADGEL